MAIRRRGYSMDDCEHELDLRCVGAPICNVAERVFVATSASGPARRILHERIPTLAELVLTDAQVISAKLDHRPEEAEGRTSGRATATPGGASGHRDAVPAGGWLAA